MHTFVLANVIASALGVAMRLLWLALVRKSDSVAATAFIVAVDLAWAGWALWLLAKD